MHLVETSLCWLQKQNPPVSRGWRVLTSEICYSCWALEPSQVALFKQRGICDSPPGVKPHLRREQRDFPAAGGTLCCTTRSLCLLYCGTGVNSGVIRRALGGLHLLRPLIYITPVTLSQPWGVIVLLLYRWEKQGPWNLSYAWVNMAKESRPGIWPSQTLKSLTFSTAMSSKIYFRKQRTWRLLFPPVENNPKVAWSLCLPGWTYESHEPEDAKHLHFPSSFSKGTCILPPLRWAPTGCCFLAMQAAQSGAFYKKDKCFSHTQLWSPCWGYWPEGPSLDAHPHFQIWILYITRRKQTWYASQLRSKVRFWPLLLGFREPSLQDPHSQLHKPQMQGQLSCCCYLIAWM